ARTAPARAPDRHAVRCGARLTRRMAERACSSSGDASAVWETTQPADRDVLGRVNLPVEVQVRHRCFLFWSGGDSLSNRTTGEAQATSRSAGRVRSRVLKGVPRV